MCPCIARLSCDLVDDVDGVCGLLNDNVAQMCCAPVGSSARNCNGQKSMLAYASELQFSDTEVIFITFIRDRNGLRLLTPLGDCIMVKEMTSRQIRVSCQDTTFATVCVVISATGFRVNPWSVGKDYSCVVATV